MKQHPASLSATERAITLEEVARQAGVSKMTVSRVLNTPHLVSEQTRHLVLDAMARTGYVPNLHAAGLRSCRTRTIACMAPTIAAGSAFLATLQPLTDALGKAGYQVMLSERGYHRSRDDEVLEAVLQRRPDGIALIGVLQSEQARKRLQATGIPIVETWEINDQPLDMQVGFSHQAIGRAVARHFHKQGRKRLASISSQESRTHARYVGFRKEALALGIAGIHLSADDNIVIESPSRLLHGRMGLARALEGDAHVDAIYSPTDMVALGILMEASDRGIDVPADLAVVGFGDFDFAAHTSPPLSTVRIDNERIGRRAAELLIGRIDGQSPAEQVVEDVGFEVITRATS